ncbi:MAG: ATP-binding protein, partial [Planctomycetota bacterium]
MAKARKKQAKAKRTSGAKKPKAATKKAAKKRPKATSAKKAKVARKKTAKKTTRKTVKKTAKRATKKTRPADERVAADVDIAAEEATAANRKGKVVAPATAEDMARRQRDISVAEFFIKNRHLLGFDNPRKALLTTIKEGVDNSLDACEEGGILPEVKVAIAPAKDENRFVVTIEDNGPGILKKQIPKIFAKLLYGSKFHRLKMSRGQQGIGISAAGMYGQLTTGKPIAITSKTAKSRPAHHYQLEIDA